MHEDAVQHAEGAMRTREGSMRALEQQYERKLEERVAQVKVRPR